MERKESLSSILIENLSQKTKDKILENFIEDPEAKLAREKLKSISISDLRYIKSKNEEEVYEILNSEYKKGQYFMYCGPLLININPGPDLMKNYLNLKNWVKETENINESEWKPHLYSFMYFVYQTMVNEKKDQVVNMLGQIGSGKTFNIIHIIEYFCCMVGPENLQIETFDIIHKSIQLTHIMGSIFRENNLESSSCGILLRLGFNNDNKICNFDFEAQILDCTLPFSENGRSFSILHSLVGAANSDIKRTFGIPEDEIHLNFFRKFSKNFSKKTKERFKLNDLEIWNRYFGLLKYFDFKKEEILEIIQIFSFLINVNELGITKGKVNEISGYVISKGQCSKRLSKILNMDEDEFIHNMGLFKEIQDIKNTLISLMKYSYYIVFEYIIMKIKFKLKTFFNNLYCKENNIQNPYENSINASTTSFHYKDTKSNNFQDIKLIQDEDKIKYINFLDFPGEVEDQTLGGLFTNAANECINLFAGSSYSSVVEQLIKEKLFLKLFKPLHSYDVVRSLIGNKGLFNYLSNNFTLNNYERLKNDCLKINIFKNCILFKDNDIIKKDDEFKFEIIYSHTSVIYNYESLYLETKNLTNTKKTYKVFGLSDNSIIKSIYKKVVPIKISFENFVEKRLYKLFSPIENLSPFVIYCLHSNNSYNIFFGNENNKAIDKNWAIPKNLTVNMLKKSLCIPVLYWEWFGYQEWIKLDSFIKIFEEDFNNAGKKLRNKSKNKDKYDNKNKKITNKNNINENEEEEYKKMNTFEKVNYILSSLFLTRDTIIGKNIIVMKKGTFMKIKKKLEKLTEDSKVIETSSSELNSKKNIKNIRNIKGIKNVKNEKKDLSKEKDIKSPSDSSKIIKNMSSKDIIEKKVSLKIQCNLLLIDKKENENKKKSNKNLNKKQNQNDEDINIINYGEKIEQTSKYNLYKIMDKSNPNDINDLIEQTDKSNEKDNLDNQINDKELQKYRKKNNIIITNNMNFDLLNKLFNYDKNTNFKIFDYSKDINDIITIQCAYRKFKAYQKRLLLKYLISKIILLQSNIRGYLIIRKYKRLKKCLDSVLMIQRNFKSRFRRVNRKIRKIQANIRRMKIQKKVERKLIRYRKCIENDEEYCDTSDEEKRKEIAKRKAKKNALENKRKLLEQKEKAKRKRNNIYDYTKPLNTIENALNKKKESKLFDLTKEKNKDNIISALLLDQNLLSEYDNMNRLLANEKGVNKNVKYELLQINKNKKDNINKNNNEKIRIEDKLISYGEEKRQKRAQDKIEKLKNQEMQYTFKPKLNKYNDKIFSNINMKNFYERAKLFENIKNQKLKEITENIGDLFESEFTFKPKILKQSQKIKRTHKDLINWKEQKDSKLSTLRIEKKNKEDEEFENLKIPLLSKKSDDICKEKKYISPFSVPSTKRTNIESTENKSGMFTKRIREDKKEKEIEEDEEEEEEEIEFKWPENIQKQYYEKSSDDKFNSYGIKNDKISEISEGEWDEEDEDDDFL